MYYPYLRGKQFELIALREFVTNNTLPYKICPIIEPVKSTFNSLKMAIDKFLSVDFKFALILNPQVGELVGKPGFIESSLTAVLADKSKWIPAFIIKRNNLSTITEYIKQCDYHNVMLICTNINSDSDELSTLLSLPNVGSVVISGDDRGFKRAVERANKLRIRIDDKFIPEKRNSDYTDENKFSEEFKYYVGDGYDGFSDFTLLSSDFIEGGRLPYAVAIHLTYKKTEDQLWVKHFISDSNDDSSNVQGKFGEAVKKAVAFFTIETDPTCALLELSKYCTDGQYPGLGVIKKISIKHHVELVNKILNSQSQS